MRRGLAVFSGLLGVLMVPLSLSGATSWLAVVANLLLAACCVVLSGWHGAAGRPAHARAWGAWFVVASIGLVMGLHVTSWARDGWGWGLPFALMCVWAWAPPAAAWVGGSVARGQRRRLSRRAVRRRHAAGRAQRTPEVGSEG